MSPDTAKVVVIMFFAVIFGIGLWLKRNGQ